MIKIDRHRGRHTFPSSLGSAEKARTVLRLLMASVADAMASAYCW